MGGAAGHGSASLSGVRLSNGRYLVEGKRMTCFPWWPELAWMDLSDYGKRLPFDMEARLRERGANLIVPAKDQADDPATNQVLDAPQGFVAGSFARGAPWVAQQMVALIRTAGVGQ